MLGLGGLGARFKVSRGGSRVARWGTRKFCGSTFWGWDQFFMFFYCFVVTLLFFWYVVGFDGGYVDVLGLACIVF